MSRHVVRRLLLASTVLLAAVTPGCSAVGSGDLRVTAMLADSAGLFVGNDVGILGVPVGTITAIEPEGRLVRVEMKVDGERAVPADVGAVVVARAGAPDRYVELTPVYSEGPRLADGAVIEEPRTRTPVDFDEVLGALNDFATGIAGSGEATDAVRSFIDEGAGALKGNGRLLNDTITGLGAAVDGVASERENVVATIRSVDQLVGTLAANEEEVRTFIRQVSAASQLLAAERGNFRRALRSLDEAVTVVAEFAVANRAEVVASVEGSTDVMTMLASNEEELTEILEVMPLALENLTRITNDGRLTVRMNPLILAPLTDQLTLLCEALPLGLCESLGTTPPLLQQLLGGGQ